MEIRLIPPTVITKRQLSIVSAILLFIVIVVRYFDARSRSIMFLDESAYLARGVAIVEEGKIPSIPLSPGVSLVHALSYLFLRSDPLGMDLAGRVTSFLGGFVLYSVLYLATLQMLGVVWGLVVVGMGLLYLPLYHVDGNSSDLLFATMISVLLLLLIRMEKNRNSPSLVVWLSLSAALTTLIRNDGFLIFVGLTPVIWVYLYACCINGSFFRRIWHFIILWLLPFVCSIAVVSFLSWKTTGVFEILPGARTYTAFEQGTGLVRRFELEKEGKNPWIEGSRIAAEIYGSRQENRESVLLALSRHPRAWVERIGYNTRDFFLRWFEAHNGQLTTVTLLLSCFGSTCLFARRRFFLAASVVALLLPTLTYFLITFWRLGYVNMYSPLVLFLSVYALASLLEPPVVRSRQIKILIGSVTAILGVVLIWLGALHSEYTYGPKGLIEGGVSLAEILGAVTVWGIFIKQVLIPERPSKQVFGVVGIAVILGIWLASSGDIFSLAFSDKTQAQWNAQLEGQKALREYIEFSFHNLRGARVCTADPSLPWYVRQQPVIVYELYDSSVRNNLMALISLMEERGCDYLLWREGGLNVSGVFKPVFTEGGITLAKYLPGSQIEGQEIVMEDFNESSMGKWFPFGNNNVQGDFVVLDGILTLTYQNNLLQRDIFAYRYNLTEPIAGVVAVKMRVRIYPGTRLTADVDVDGELVSPRFLNYYPGTGDWEEVIIPVGGTLNSLTIGIGEWSEGDNSPSYRVEIAWIKAIVER